MECSTGLAHGIDRCNPADVCGSRLSMEGLAEPLEIHPHGAADDLQCFGIFSHIPDRTSGRDRAATLAYAMRTDSTYGIVCNHHRRAFPRHARVHRVVWLDMTIAR